MNYLLPCQCGLSVEVEPSQAGQMVGCVCGENLLVPSMLQVKALPIAPEKPKQTREKCNAVSYKAVIVLLFAGVICAILWGTLELIYKGLVPLPHFYMLSEIIPFLYTLFSGLTGAFFLIAVALTVRNCVKSPLAEDTTQRRIFFVLGCTLLFPACILASHLYAWKPQPWHVLAQREFFSYGSSKRLLPYNSTPISSEERQILLMTNERIDQMRPMQLFFYFQTLKEPTFSYDFQVKYEAVKDTYRIGITTNVIFFILAFSSIIVSFFLPRQEVVVTGWSGNEW